MNANFSALLQVAFALPSALALAEATGATGIDKASVALNYLLPMIPDGLGNGTIVPIVKLMINTAIAGYNAAKHKPAIAPSFGS